MTTLSCEFRATGSIAAVTNGIVVASRFTKSFRSWSVFRDLSLAPQ